MPVAIPQFVLDISVVVASMGTPSMDNDGLEFVSCGIWVFLVLSVEVVSHVEFQGVLKAVVKLLPLHGFIIKVKSLEAEGKHWWQSFNSIALQSVCLLVAIIAKQLVVPIQLVKLKESLQAVSHSLAVPHLEGEIQEVFLSLARHTALLTYYQVAQ